jgi:hypothetical protein
VGHSQKGRITHPYCPNCSLTLAKAVSFLERKGMVRSKDWRKKALERVASKDTVYLKPTELNVPDEPEISEPAFLVQDKLDWTLEFNPTVANELLTGALELSKIDPDSIKNRTLLSLKVRCGSKFITVKSLVSVLKPYLPSAVSYRDQYVGLMQRDLTIEYIVNQINPFLSVVPSGLIEGSVVEVREENFHHALNVICGSGLVEINSLEPINIERLLVSIRMLTPEQKLLVAMELEKNV